MTGGPPKFSKKDCRAFVNQLDSFWGRQLKKFSKGIVKTGHLYA